MVPKLYKAQAKRELTEEQRITLNMGGTLAPTAPPAGIAGTGIAVFAQVSAHTQHRDAPPPPPETYGAYAKKSEESGGVIAMIDLLVKDLEKEMTEAKTEEKDAQADYEKAMSDSSSKRAADSKTLADKEGTKANMEADLESIKEGKASTAKELQATARYIHSLHLDCDWLLKYFDMREAARAGEADSLGSGKAVLSGADFSLLQLSSGRFLSRT